MARMVDLYPQGNTAMHKAAEIPNISLGLVYNAAARHRQYRQSTRYLSDRWPWRGHVGLRLYVGVVGTTDGAVY